MNVVDLCIEAIFDHEKTTTTKNAKVNMKEGWRPFAITAKFCWSDDAWLFYKTTPGSDPFVNLRWVHLQWRAMYRHWAEVSLHQLRQNPKYFQSTLNLTDSSFIFIRCDQTSNCADESDEDNCKLIFMKVYQTMTR